MVASVAPKVDWVRNRAASAALGVAPVWASGETRVLQAARTRAARTPTQRDIPRPIESPDRFTEVTRRSSANPSALSIAAPRDNLAAWRRARVRCAFKA